MEDEKDKTQVPIGVEPDIDDDLSDIELGEAACNLGEECDSCQ